MRRLPKWDELRGDDFGRETRASPVRLAGIREELRSQSGQTLADYALILGGIAIVVVVAIVFLGGGIGELFGGTGSSVQPRPATFTPPRPSAVSFPATLHDCQEGRWRNYSQFTTESECAAYVDQLTP